MKLGIFYQISNFKGEVMGKYSRRNDVKISLDCAFSDPEFDDAVAADENEIYYWVYNTNGGRTIKKYKPSVAVLFSERDGLKRVPF